MYAFMYPYFIAGFLFNKINGVVLYKKYVKKDWPLFVVSIIIFIFLYSFYNKDSYIYITAISLLEKKNKLLVQLGIDLYRYIIGFSGSLVVILGCKLITGRRPGLVLKLIVYWGRISLGIYILNSYSNLYLIAKITQNFSPNLLIWIVETIFSMAVYVVIIESIRKFPIANKLLLGGR